MVIIKTLVMVSLKLKVIVFGLVLIGFMGCADSPKHQGFEGTWQCKEGAKTTITFNKIGDKTYEIDFGGNIVFSGELNDDGVLAAEMMGNVSRFSIHNGELRFSGILADECTLYVKK